MDFFEKKTEIIDLGFNFTANRRDYAETDFTADYQIVRCSGCEGISFISSKYYSEYAEIDTPGTWTERFPEPVSRKEKDFCSLPSTLTKIYGEVIKTYNHGCYILCAAGIRALLEGICKEKNITNGVLETKINEMCNQGFITKHQETILHELRFLGNDVLHELQMPSKKDIDAALDILEHIVVSLYEISEKAETLKNRKKQKRKP